MPSGNPKRERRVTEEEYRRLHSQHRLPLTERIEVCLNRLIDTFPGFQYETIVGEKGWGGKVRRDDTLVVNGKRGNYFSLFEIVVAPYSKYRVLDMKTKGTIRNKKAITRSYYERLDDADIEQFQELIEQWVLEYAEQFAAS